jgi:hypothetical protein
MVAESWTTCRRDVKLLRLGENLKVPEITSQGID